MGIFDTSFYIFHLALYTHSYWFCINKIKFVKQNTFCLLSYSIEYFRHKKKLSRCSFFVLDIYNVRLRYISVVPQISVSYVLDICFY